MLQDLMRVNKARRSGRVRRFHTTETIKVEDVAQHSFNIQNLLLIMLGTEEVSRDLLLAALTHDMGEIETGDIPANVKKALPPAVRAEVEALEKAAVFSIHPKLAVRLSQDEVRYLKIADRLDGLLKCSDEVRLGNTTITQIGERYCDYLSTLLEDEPSDEIHSFVVEAIYEFRKGYLK